jgi:hypothetical protein
VPFDLGHCLVEIVRDLMKLRLYEWIGFAMCVFAYLVHVFPEFVERTHGGKINLGSYIVINSYVERCIEVPRPVRAPAVMVRRSRPAEALTRSGASQRRTVQAVTTLSRRRAHRPTAWRVIGAVVLAA